MVRIILRLEGLTALSLAIGLYFFYAEASWILLAALILVPDISMLGYVRNTRLGAITYNLGHNYILAVAVSMSGVLLDNSLTTSLGLILVAHIGMDRAMEYGLKYTTHFKDTHLSRL